MHCCILHTGSIAIKTCFFITNSSKLEYLFLVGVIKTLLETSSNTSVYLSGVAP